MKRVPVRALASPSRVVISSGEMEAKVELFSIPSLDATGEAELVDSSTIDSGKLLLRGGEVLISKLNPRKPRVHLVPEHLAHQAVCSPEFVVLQTEFEADPRYLTYSLLSERVRQDLDSEVRSATRSHQRVEPAVILATRVHAATQAEQRRIADFLDDQVARIDAIVRARSRQMALLDSAHESFISDRTDELVSKFGLVPLRRFATGIEQGWSPVAASTPAQGDSPGVLKLGSVRRGEFIPDENKEFPLEVEPNESYRVHTGDLLVTRANTPALVGDAAVVQLETNRRLYLSDLIYRVRLADADPPFMSGALRASRTRQELATLARGTSRSMAKLRGEDVLNLPVPAAPVSLQTELGAEEQASRRNLRHQRADLTDFVQRITEYKQSLITAAVSGELDVSTASGRRVPVTA